jgi:hypothetical protein
MKLVVECWLSLSVSVSPRLDVKLVVVSPRLDVKLVVVTPLGMSQNGMLVITVLAMCSVAFYVQQLFLCRPEWHVGHHGVADVLCCIIRATTVSMQATAGAQHRGLHWQLAWLRLALTVCSAIF